jgi:hypothetical protein
MDDFKTSLHDAPGHVHGNASLKRPPRASASSKAGRCINGIVSLRRSCRAYNHVDFRDELADMATSTRNLPSSQYWAESTGHKFCLAAPGDFVSTPKITEFVAMGAFGGCLPVLVLSGKPSLTLPFTRWLDWCSIAFLVSDGTARHGMKSVLAKLELVTAEEAATRRDALRAVRDAFVFRAPYRREPGESEASGTGAASGHDFRAAYRPSAVDFIIGELCEAARSAGRNETLAAQPLAGGAYSRCML